MAIVAITRQGRTAQAALRAQSGATLRAMASERVLAQEERLWHRRAELYAQVLRPITEVHAEKTRDIVRRHHAAADPA